VKDTDWYIVAIDGSAIEPTRAGVRLAQRLEFSRPPPFGPQAWLESEQAVLFSAREGDFIDLWKMPFSLATGRATGPPERFTSGGSAEYDASASSAGRVVYSSLEQNIDLWLLPLDSDGSGQGGPPRRLTTGVGSEFLPRISANGSTIAYLSASSAVNTQKSQVPIAGVSPWRVGPTIGPVGSYRNLSLNRDGSEIVY
jgi:hypothetical protein